MKKRQGILTVKPPDGNGKKLGSTPNPGFTLGKLGIAMTCLSTVVFLTCVQDVFGIPKLWLSAAGVAVGLWARRSR